MLGPSLQPLAAAAHHRLVDHVQQRGSALQQTFLVAVAYFLTGRIGLELATPPGYATAAWLPSGIAFSAALLCGYRIWPGIALGSFCINVALGFDASTTAALAKSLAIPASIGCGAALQAVVGAYLVRRFVGFPSGLLAVGQVARFFLLGGALACLVNSTVAIATLYAAGRVLASNAPFNWATWWAGDTIGVFVATPVIMAWFAPPGAQWRRRRVPITAAVVGTFLAVVVMAIYTAALDRTRLVSDFNDRTGALPVELDKATGTYFDAVNDIEILLDSSAAPDRAQFSLFASGIRSHVPGIQALEWAPQVRPAERAAFEAAARNQGITDFEIKDYVDGRATRAAERAEYFPVTYVEPVGGNEPAIGFDLGSRPDRLDAMRMARDTGKTTVSDRITLVQGGNGFLVFTPAYRLSARVDTIDLRRRNFIGFAIGVFRFADLMQTAFRGYDLSGTNFWLIDETQQEHPLVLYSNSTDPPSEFQLREHGLFGGTAKIGNRSALDVGGRRWIFQTAPTQVFLARNRQQDAWIVLILGLVFTGLVGAFVVVLTGREGMLRVLFDGNPQPMWAYDRETLRIVEVNEEAVLKYGYSRAQFAEMRIVDLQPPDDVRRLTNSAPLASGADSNLTESRHLLRDGRVIDVEISGHDVELSGREVALVVAQDVTERKSAQQALIESEEIARGIIDTAFDAFVQIDEHGRILEWNPRAEATFGWSRLEAIGRILGDLIVPLAYRARHQDGLARYLRTGESTILGKRIELDALRKDGREIKVELAVTGLRRKSGHVFNAFISDITDRLATEERNRQAQKMEVVGQLTGGIAHDFNNILTIITGSIETLSEALGDRSDLAAIASTIDEAAERGSELTQRLLAFARKQPLQPRYTDINPLIVETAKLLRPLLGEQIEVQFALNADASMAFVDPSQLTTSVINLAINARDAMRSGGRLTLETSNVDLDRSYTLINPDANPGSYVVIVVSDNGSGMPEAVRDKIFEPFFTTKEPGKGTGLGLSMVYGFIRQSGGHIEVDSQEGRGTSVKLYLPKAIAPAKKIVETKPEVGIAGGNETILLAEDDAHVRNSVQAQLESLGYKVLATANAAQALAVAEAGAEFDLLFTDVIMPGALDGLALADELLKRRPSLRVLFTSGYAEKAVLHHGRLEPGTLLLAKPYRKSELARMVRLALDR